MRRTLRVASATAVASILITGTVFADKIFIEDPAGDSQGNNIDIVLAKSGHGAGDVIKARATYAKKVNPNDLPPHLLINVPGGAKPDFIVAALENNTAVFDTEMNFVAKASVTPVGERGFKIKFREKAIGNPKRYGWAFSAIDEHGNVVDLAPDAGFVRHNL